MNQPVELVEFDVADAARVAGWSASAEDSFFWCGQRLFPMSPELVGSWSGQPAVRAFVLREAGSPVAYGELWLDEQEVELARLIVAPAARGRGLGRRLLSALGARAGHTGVPLVFLRVNPTNAPALRCYTAAGWREVDEATTAEWNAEQPLAYRWFVRPGGSGPGRAG